MQANRKIVPFFRKNSKGRPPQYVKLLKKNPILQIQPLVWHLGQDYTGTIQAGHTRSK